MKTLLTLLALSVSSVLAQTAAWGQCGGQGFTGSTSCVSGYTCVRQDQWYSQCRPGSGSGGTTTTTATTTSGGGSGGTLTCPGNSGSGCGRYTVSGLGARKRAILACGGSVADLAHAMMETEGMTTNYAYGDNKSGDAANFGVFKQNWLMIRSTASQFRGQTASQYNNGAVLNNDLCLDVNIRKGSEAYYGYDRWVAGHRNGETGLNNPNTNDITLFKRAAEWTKQQLQSNSAYQTDDTRFWVDVVAI